MHFASDNAGPVHPKVMEAMSAANHLYQVGYGAEDAMKTVQDQIRTAFNTPNAQVYLVATGTTANVLALSCMAKPWDAIFCTPMAHIEEDECNAPEFYTGGAKLHLVPARDGRMTPADLDAAMRKTGGSVHNAQTGPVSFANVTETGTVYSCDDIAALCDVAKRHGSKVHLDGARFANAVAAQGCAPADMTWRAGVDVLSFGGTKNGLMGVEAVVFFDPDLAHEFEFRRKRGGHLFSKHRFLSAQMQAYLTDDLWLGMAQSANAIGQRLAQGIAAIPGARLLYPAQANMMFARFARAKHQRLHDAGAVYYLMDGPLDGVPTEEITCRLVCDWSCTETAVDQFVQILSDA